MEEGELAVRPLVAEVRTQREEPEADIKGHLFTKACIQSESVRKHYIQQSH